MLLAFSIIIDVLLICIFLLLVAQVDVSKNIMRVVTVVFASAICNIAVNFLLTFWLSATQMVAFWTSFAVYFLVIYSGISWFFDLEARAKLIIMGVLVISHVILAFIL